DNESQTSQPSEESDSVSKDYITALEARNAAIAYLRTEQGLDIKVQSVSHKFDSEKMVYLVTLKTEDNEYRVKVNAIDGAILGWESEKVSDTSVPETNIPKIKGEVEFLDIPFEVNVITVPLLEPALAAGQYMWNGNIALSPEWLLLDGNGAEYWKPDEGEPSYNQWIQKYTDEWFEENWLIVFLGTRYEFDLKHIGFHFEDGKQPIMLFIYDEGDSDFKWDRTYGSYAFVEISKKDIPYDIGETYKTEGISFEQSVFFFRALSPEWAEAYGYKLSEEPSLKGELENLQFDYNVEIIKMPLVYENHGIAGNFNNGFFVTDPEWLIFDDYHNMCYDTENYEKFITKYTDEWFEDNYLIKFISYVPTFDCKGTGVYTVGEDDHHQTLYFLWDMNKDRDKQEKYWMTHYYVFIEIPKENIEYDLTEFDFEAVSMVKALDYTC
ncbi:MAG: hypothetical protein J6V56_07425, partial [Clostridia bacterium]|nr:hypothetical protein [Clostridia bacterium]